MCPMFYFHTIRFVRSKIRKMDKENARTRNGTKLFFFFLDIPWKISISKLSSIYRLFIYGSILLTSNYKKWDQISREIA